MTTPPVGDRLRRDTPYGVSSDEKASSLTPCPRSGQSRPGWLWHGHCCPLDKEVRRAYGIGCVDYHRRLEAQGGVCAVCGRRPGRWRLAVDHEHDPPYGVRGLAHHRCQRWITREVVRYLADPPGRDLGLAVPRAKVRRLEAKDRTKRERAKARKARPAPTQPSTNGFHERTQAALAATRQGGS